MYIIATTEIVTKTGHKKKKQHFGAGEIAQWLTVFIGLPGIQVQYPAPTCGPQGSVTPVPGDVTLSSGLHSPQTYMWYTDIKAGKVDICLK